MDAKIEIRDLMKSAFLLIQKNTEFWLGFWP